MKNKAAAFWFHYNKPESKKRGHVVMSVHYKKQCFMVRNIECNVPISTRIKKTQPVVVMAGKGVMTIHNDVAHIV